tara:strand:- start:1586 stop:3160 length:1575 start_codon:yes stop_codon:yes gene_type:complete
MSKIISTIFIFLTVVSCSDNRVNIFVKGSEISGVNGIHFGPDGNLYAASVIGSDISVIDINKKKIIKRFGLQHGVIGPDDLAFNSKGEFFWTSILTGEVAGFNQNGEKVIAGNVGIGVNPITFSDDDRLFVAQCFYDDGVYEVDPTGKTLPRLIIEGLGPECGLNGMDWGPDGRLYGPRWFHNEVVSLDVKTGEIRVEVSNLNVPAAVKFNSKGELYILDTGDGKIFKFIDGFIKEIAILETGLDNLAFNEKDELFVSSYADGYILKVSEDNIESILPGGVSHPGGLTVYKSNLVVADVQSVKAYNTQTKERSWSINNVFRTSELGATTSVSNLGDKILLTSWIDNTVKIFNPITKKIERIFNNLNIPISAIEYGNSIAVALHGEGSIILLSKDGNLQTTLLRDLTSPTHLINFEDNILISDREEGIIYEINTLGEKKVFLEGLNSPEGIAYDKGVLYIHEGNTGNIKKYTEGKLEIIATIPAGNPSASSLQPPSMILNGLAIHQDILYISDEVNRSILQIQLD